MPNWATSSSTCGPEATTAACSSTICAQAVLQWTERYHQRCWLRQLTPDTTRQQENALLRVIARMDGTAFPTTARLTGRWLRGRLPTINDWVRGIPFVDKKVREQTRRRREERKMSLATAYCAETVAITYEDMGLLVTDKDTHWFDPGKFWSGDTLPLAPGYQLGERNRGGRRLGDLHARRHRSGVAGQIQHRTVRVDRFLQFAVPLRRLRPAHRDHQPHLVESRADRVIETRPKKPCTSRSPSACAVMSSTLTPQLFGPDAPGDDLAGQQRGQVVLDRVRGLAVAAQRWRLVDLDPILTEADRAGHRVVSGGRGLKTTCALDLSAATAAPLAAMTPPRWVTELVIMDMLTEPLSQAAPISSA